MSDQLRLHTELQTEECLSFATYICSMETQSDMDEFLSSLMQEVPPARRAKIIKECIKRRGLFSTTTPPPTLTPSQRIIHSNTDESCSPRQVSGLQRNQLFLESCKHKKYQLNKLAVKQPSLYDCCFLK